MMNAVIRGLKASLSIWEGVKPTMLQNSISTVHGSEVPLDRVDDAFHQLISLVEALKDKDGSDIDFARNHITGQLDGIEKHVQATSPQKPQFTINIFNTLNSLFTQFLPIYIVHEKASKFSVLRNLRDLSASQQKLRSLEAELNAASERIESVVATVPEAEKRLKRIEEVHTSANSISDDINNKQGTVTGVSKTVVALQSSIQKSADNIQLLSTQAAGLQTDAKENLKQTESTKLQIEDLKKKIEKLLPGATSAGLAVSFHKRASRLFWMQLFWGLLFAISVVLIAVISIDNPIRIWMGIKFSEAELVDVGSIKFKIERILVIAPLVWLGWFFARQFGFTTRLQEQYKFKAAVSAAFEGYKDQMKDVGAEALQKLSTEAIDVLTDNPGDVFDKSNQAHPIEGFSFKGLGWFFKK